MKKFISVFTIICLVSSFALLNPLFSAPSKWAEESVFSLEVLGILDGDLADSSKMDDFVTREEFAELITKFYSYVNEVSLARFGRISPFEDTKSRYVVAAYKLGIVKGVSDTEFAPSRNITREQIATMMYRAISVMDLSDSNQDSSLFADDSNISSWARDGVYFCKADKLVQGVGKDKFAPKGLATREQVIKILDNALISYNKGFTKSLDMTKAYGRYKLPDDKKSLLVYSSDLEKGIELRITAPNYANGLYDFDILGAAQEMYYVLSPVLGHERAKAAAVLMRENWSLTNMSFSDNGFYVITEDGKALKSGSLTSDLKMSFNGACTLEISR